MGALDQADLIKVVVLIARKKRAESAKNLGLVPLKRKIRFLLKKSPVAGLKFL
jgi:hypothetical protein